MSGSPAGEDAFDEFYHWNVRKVVHLVYAYTGDLTLAQDCTQEAFSRAWQQWSKVSAYDDPLAWVRTVARRLAISAWRKKTNQNRAHVRHIRRRMGCGASPRWSTTWRRWQICQPLCATGRPGIGALARPAAPAPRYTRSWVMSI